MIQMFLAFWLLLLPCFFVLFFVLFFCLFVCLLLFFFVFFQKSHRVVLTNQTTFLSSSAFLLLLHLQQSQVLLSVKFTENDEVSNGAVHKHKQNDSKIQNSRIGLLQLWIFNKQIWREKKWPNNRAFLFHIWSPQLNVSLF